MLSRIDIFNIIKENFKLNNLKFIELRDILFLFAKCKKKIIYELSIQIILSENCINIFTKKYEYSYYRTNNYFDIDLVERVLNDINLISTLRSYSNKDKEKIFDQMEFNEAFYIKKYKKNKYNNLGDIIAKTNFY
jgi:hypothetical protein